MRATIDERIVAAIKIIDNKKIKELEKSDEKDREKLKEAIEYLKDYAKIQTASKMLTNQEAVEKDIEDTKNRILNAIEQKKAEIQNMPKVDKRKKKISGLYAFENDLQKQEEERIQNEEQKRAEAITELKQDISKYKEKLKKLNSLKAKLSNPNKAVEVLFPKEQFVISGSSIQKLIPKELEELMKCQNIILAGYLSDEQVKAIMEHCKAFIFPSYFEGFGIPPLEALYCGCPIIIANSSCLPEIYEDCAHYIDPTDANINLDELLKEKVANPEKLFQKYSARNQAEKLYYLIQNI